MKKETCADLRSANICICALIRDAMALTLLPNAQLGHANARTLHHLDGAVISHKLETISVQY